MVGLTLNEPVACRPERIYAFLSNTIPRPLEHLGNHSCSQGEAESASYRTGSANSRWPGTSFTFTTADGHATRERGECEDRSEGQPRHIVDLGLRATILWFVSREYEGGGGAGKVGVSRTMSLTCLKDVPQDP
jgi:hypothetical protein